MLIEQCLDHLDFKSGVVDEQVLSPAICDDTTLLRLARTLRQDFKFASAEPPLSQLSRLFGRLRTFDWWSASRTGRYGTYFTVIDNYRPLLVEYIYSHVVRHQGHNNAFPVIISAKLAIRINPWCPSPWRSRQEDVQIQEENWGTRMRCEVNVEQRWTWNYWC